MFKRSLSPTLDFKQPEIDSQDVVAPRFSLSDIAVHPRLWRRIPRDHWPAFQQACRPFFRAYAAASTSGEVSSMFSALLALMKLPSTSLIRSRGGKKKRRAIRSLLANLRNLQNRSVSDVASQQSHFSPSPESADPTAERIARAKALIELGHVSRAARSLLQAPLPPVNERVTNDLQDLHPPSSGPSPHLPPDSPTLQLADTVIRARLIRSSLANGSSPGPSGWTGDLLLALIDDHNCLIGLHQRHYQWQSHWCGS